MAKVPESLQPMSADLGFARRPSDAVTVLGQAVQDTTTVSAVTYLANLTDQ